MSTQPVEQIDVSPCICCLTDTSMYRNKSLKQYALHSHPVEYNNSVCKDKFRRSAPGQGQPEAIP